MYGSNCNEKLQLQFSRRVRQEKRASESFRLTCSNCASTNMRERRYHPATQLAICTNCFNYYKIHQFDRPSHFEYKITGRKENKNADKSKGVKRSKTRSEYRKTEVCHLCNMRNLYQYFQCPFTAKPTCPYCFEKVKVMKRGAPLLKNSAAVRYKHAESNDKLPNGNDSHEPARTEPLSPHFTPNPHPPGMHWNWNYWNQPYFPNYEAPLFPNYQFQQQHQAMHGPYSSYNNYNSSSNVCANVNSTATQNQHFLGLVTTDQMPLLDLSDADFQ